MLKRVIYGIFCSVHAFAKHCSVKDKIVQSTFSDTFVILNAHVVNNSFHLIIIVGMFTTFKAMCYLVSLCAQIATKVEQGQKGWRSLISWPNFFSSNNMSLGFPVQ
jgi:hypothetical protein